MYQFMSNKAFLGFTLLTVFFSFLLSRFTSQEMLRKSGMQTEGAEHHPTAR